MTNEEQTQHWLKFHRYQQRYEGLYTPQFNKAIQTQNKQFTDTGTLMAVDSTSMLKPLHDLYFESAYIWAHRATADLRKERLTMGFSARIVELMKQYYGIDLLNLADDLTRTTKDEIGRVLAQAATEGFGFDEVVKRLTDPSLTRARARLIARTETVASANAASNVAARESKLLVDKIWIAARDNRTRQHHREVNQSVVGLNDKFVVGGFLMDFPGDKAGGAAEVCNCRCTHAFIPRRDERGRLIRS